MSKIKILVPIYNDWQSVFKLLENINSEVLKLDSEFSVIIVNDASTENKPEFLIDFNFSKSVESSGLASMDASLTIITEKSPSNVETITLIFSKSLKTDFQSL